GTSFAVMVFTAFSSMLGQHKKQTVDWKTIFAMMPGMIFGVFAGALSAKYIPAFGLQIFFIRFLTAVAFKTLHTGRQTASCPLPGLPGLTA
ncbi:sulfite exporter TauE/SafE family protein, partial [Escherichia coli]|uniref:sulfite exporter TauE/SafE family protein n=1 Tax=Escherichia coli TaxID=562 RepID=UPI001F4AC9C3